MTSITLTIGFFFIVLFLLPASWIGIPVVIDFIQYTLQQRSFQKALAKRRLEAEELARRQTHYGRDEKFVARWMASQRLMKKGQL